MRDRVLAVSTRQSIARILGNGGVSDLFLDLTKSARCQYAICVRSTRAEPFTTPEPPGSAFLIGRISRVTRLPGPKRRALIDFSEFARIEVLDFLPGWKNPVRYIPSQEVERLIASASFEPMPPVERPAELIISETDGDAHGVEPGQRPISSSSIEAAIAARLRRMDQLTIQAAKEVLAKAFGVRPDQIEITIKA